ncbi:MAG: hypothetical protein ACYC3X_05170 [Pirellulaceae bacterium]
MSKTTRILAMRLAWVVLAGMLPLCAAAEPPGDYAVVVSRSTYDDAGWKKVAESLVSKHAGKLLVYESNVNESLKPLQTAFPRYTAFVATPSEATPQFVAEVSRLARKYDEDSYTDTFWGIVTGFDANNALRIAQTDQPLVVRKVVSGTDVALDMCQEGTWYCELVKNRMVHKAPGEKPQLLKGPDDTTAVLVDLLNKYQPDLFVTSGHATERDWQIGFRYRNGSFRSQAGKLSGVDSKGAIYPVDSPNPKVYLPIGNCLMGHIDSTDAMALAWMNSAGVRQMIGYTVPTWFGYAGWGCLDYFVEQPGRYTFAEAFIANQHALVYRLSTAFPALMQQDPPPGVVTAREAAVAEAAKAEQVVPADGPGLLHDRDVLAFYGDPAWQARMADGDKAWEQTLTEEDGVFTLEITPRHGDKSFAPVNSNGSQRGWRPFVQFLPQRIGPAQVLEGQDLRPVIVDDFVLVPNPRTCEANRVYRVKFRAQPVR